MHDITLKHSELQEAIYSNGKLVGKVSQGKFKRRIKYSIHALQKPPALALSLDVLRQMEQAGTHEIEMTDIESGKIFRTTLAKFYRFAIPIQRGNFGRQLALPIKYWEIFSKGEKANQKPWQMKLI